MDDTSDVWRMVADAMRDVDEAQRKLEAVKRLAVAKLRQSGGRAETDAVPPAADAVRSTKAPVVDGVIDYDAAYKAQVEAWHKRHTYPMERVAREILRTISAAPTGRWMRLDRFREINAPLHAQNSLGIGRAAVRLGAVVALVDSDASKKQLVIERWKRLAMAGRKEIEVAAGSTMERLVELARSQRLRLERSANVEFFLLSWAAMNDRPIYAAHTGLLAEGDKRLALQQLQTFSAWMAGSDS